MNLILTSSNSIVVLVLALFILSCYFTNKEYKKTTYYQITHHSLLSVRFDVGRYGEYLTYRYLRNQEANGAKFLFNVYIPKKDGKTTEIDVMMIHPKGVFVFESKNYSGWIFGSETQKMWTQTLPVGRGRSQKESFYNPIMQNQSHIKHLNAFLGEYIPTRSVIVFSERCTLKKLQLKSEDIYVIKRNQVDQIVNTICNTIPNEALNDTEILNIYNRLYPFTQVSEAVKEQHIRDIQTKNTYVSTSINISTQQQECQNKSEADNAEKATLCPWCGGKLVLRTAKRGANVGKQFYGCSNYPKCKYTYL